MPMFPVEGGRPLATRPMRAADATYGAAVVDEHLGTLLGEHLLPVRTRRGADDEPYLLAVDVHGRPVVVEVVGVLDGASLLRALVYLGRAARLSLRDLASLYHGGAQRFSADLATFRESVPATRLVPADGGARLLLVCAEVGQGMADVVGGLADRGIDVLRVGLVEGPHGSLVDVSPVHLAAPDGSWSVSNGVASLSTRNSVTAPGVGEPPDEDTVSQRPPGRPGVVTRVPTGIRPVVGVPAQSPAGPAEGLPVPVWPAVHADGADARAEDSADAVEDTADTAEDRDDAVEDAAAGHDAGHRPVQDDPGRHEAGRDRGPDAAAQEEPAQDAPVQEEVAVATAAAAPAVPVNGANRAVPGPLPVRRPTAAGQVSHRAAPGVPVVAGDGRLSGLAANGPVALVWHRRRRAEYHEALVHPDGLIELTDGTRVIDPSAAAEIASGSQVPVDGWRVWRVGREDGPTLAEACGL